MTLRNPDYKPGDFAFIRTAGCDVPARRMDTPDEWQTPLGVVRDNLVLVLHRLVPKYDDVPGTSAEQRDFAWSGVWHHPAIQAHYGATTGTTAAERVLQAITTLEAEAHDNSDRIAWWEQIADHPAFEECYQQVEQDGGTLVDAMCARLSDLVDTEEACRVSTQIVTGLDTDEARDSIPLGRSSVRLREAADIIEELTESPDARVSAEYLRAEAEDCDEVARREQIIETMMTVLGWADATDRDRKRSIINDVVDMILDGPLDDEPVERATGGTPPNLDDDAPKNPVEEILDKAVEAYATVDDLGHRERITAVVDVVARELDPVRAGANRVANKIATSQEMDNFADYVKARIDEYRARTDW